MKLAFQLLAIFTTFSLSFAHPIHNTPRELTIVGLSQSSKREVPPSSTGGHAGTTAPELQLLADGNKAFREDLTKNAPTLLQTLTDEGQAPPFMFIGCSDSRVSEGTIFSAKPGTLFSERNIANQFFATDPNTHAVVSYAVAVLNVKHVVVMGHYGCGGVAAAISSAPPSKVDSANGAVQAWIQPIREIFQTSSRPEIVELREKIKGQTNVEEPDVKEPGFRALVEENVKAGVKRLATDSIIANHYAALAAAPSSPSNTTTTSNAKRADHHSSSTPSELYIHGWVYDIEDGVVRDLGVSVGPPGKTIPSAPWDAVVGAAASTTSNPHENVNVNTSIVAGGETEKRCEQLCKAKRFFFGRNV